MHDEPRGQHSINGTVESEPCNLIFTVLEVQCHNFEVQPTHKNEFGAELKLCSKRPGDRNLSRWMLSDLKVGIR